MYYIEPLPLVCISVFFQIQNNQWFLVWEIVFELALKSNIENLSVPLLTVCFTVVTLCSSMYLSYVVFQEIASTFIASLKVNITSLE